MRPPGRGTYVAVRQKSAGGGHVDQDQPRQLLRGFPAGAGDRPCGPAHRHGGRCRAVYRPHRRALRAACLRRLRPRGRLRQGAGRRHPGLPHRVRPHRRRHLAQRHRQPRLCAMQVRRAGLCRRHAEHALHGHRPQGELQPRDRHRLCALGRPQPARRRGAGLRALGDGEEARPGEAGAGRLGAGARRRGGAGGLLHSGRPADGALRPRARGLAPRAGRITRRASASIMSTA